MGELAGVIKVDNRLIGYGEVGPMTKRLTISIQNALRAKACR